MRGKLLALLGTVLACTIIILACEQSTVDITGPTDSPPPTSTDPIFQGDANSDDESADSADDESEGPINAAEGKLVIRGNYGECRQKTDFPRNYMSIFRVLEGRAQTRIELYKNGEGNIPCGFEIQIDCTVRDPDPTARPSAYDLYDHTIDTFACRPDPPCTSCGPPPPPKCDQEELIQIGTEECGELGVKHFDFEECTFECNEDNGSCEPTGEPECDEQTWDSELCEWVGECEPECDLEQLRSDAYDECSPNDFTINEDACTFDCCDQVVNQRGFFSQLNGGEEVDSCPVPCEPTGEPECPEQTWDPGSCRWVGECEEECEVPGEGIIEGVQTGNADTECSSIGYDGAGKDESGPPWNVSGDFYLVKCGNEYEVQHSVPTGSTCDVIENDVGRKKDISHVTACVCEEDDSSSDD